MLKSIKLMNELPKELSYSAILIFIIMFSKLILNFLNKSYELKIKERNHIMNHQYRMRRLLKRAEMASQSKETRNET